MMVVSTLAACPGRGTRYGGDEAWAGRGVHPDAYGHYIRGRKAAFEGRHEEAVAELRLAAVYAPDEPSLRVAIAEELLADGRVDEAALEVRAILQRWPEEPSAWIVRGRVLARQDDARGAVLAY